MAARRPRGGGYYNATLGTTGVAVEVPITASGLIVHCGAACYVGVGDATLRTFNTTEYGVMGAGQSETFALSPGVRSEESHIHVAAITGTAAVSIMFL
jgi:hypothetical protein